MGTRSTVKFIDRYGKNLLSLYNQYDGYYEGIGEELLEFFKNKENYGNGFSDTALLYVCYKKQGKPYHTYLTTQVDLQEYNYEIQDTEDGLRFTIIRDYYFDDNKYGTKTELSYGTLKDFEEEIKTKK